MAFLGLTCSALDLSIVGACELLLHGGMWDLVPWPGTESRPPALGVWTLVIRPALSSLSTPLLLLFLNPFIYLNYLLLLVTAVFSVGHRLLTMVASRCRAQAVGARASAVWHTSFRTRGCQQSQHRDSVIAALGPHSWGAQACLLRDIWGLPKPGIEPGIKPGSCIGRQDFIHCVTGGIHSSVDGRLGCFHVLSAVHSAAVNIGVHVSFWIMVFSGYMPWRGIAGPHGSFIF